MDKQTQEFAARNDIDPQREAFKKMNLVGEKKENTVEWIEHFTWWKKE